MKKLKISTVPPNHKPTPYFDTNDPLLAKKHQGRYLIVNIKKYHSRSSNRLYLSSKEDKEYFWARKDRDRLNGSNVPKQFKYHLFDISPGYEKFIKSTLCKIITDVIDYGAAIRLLNGLCIFIEILKKAEIALYDFEEITNYHQKISKKLIDNISITRTDRKDLRVFFGSVEKNLEHFDVLDFNKVKRKESITALPSSVVFQLDYFARQELNYIISQAKEYQSWISEINDTELFSIKNLVYTYHQCKLAKKRGSGAFNGILNKLLKNLHNIDLAFLGNSTDEVLKSEYKRLVRDCKDGTNIEITNEKMFALWHKELYSDYPYSKKISKKYTFIYRNNSSFTNIYLRKLKKDIEKFYARIYPTRDSVYPLILLLLIREGLNVEVLYSWKIRKIKEKYYLGDETSFALIVDGIKGRGNSIQTTSIGINTEQKKYIDFYLEWLKPIYNNTKKNKFLQYLNVGGTHVTKEWNSMQLNETKVHFLKKYSLIDLDGKRITSVDNRSLRVNSNYADYMRGLTEFERQQNKGHKHINTQVYYENNTEWIGEKKHKIAKAQNIVLSTILDESNDGKINKLFNGVIADCSDQTLPTYPGAPKLKDNERCSDMFKCLTQCDKSKVIPKIHGPAIYARVKYMDEEKEEYLRISDWEKEYLLDYKAALATINEFTDEEKKHGQINMGKYVSVVKKRFQSKLKIN